MTLKQRLEEAWDFGESYRVYLVGKNDPLIDDMLTEARSLISEDIEALVLERRTIKTDCDEAHPQAGVYHPNGHEKTLLTIDQQHLIEYLGGQI